MDILVEINIVIILVHILSTRTRRSTETQLANTFRDSLGMEVFEPFSRNLDILFACVIACSSTGSEVSDINWGKELACSENWQTVLV